MGHTSFQYNRRTFMRNGMLAAGALSLGPAFLHRAFAAGPVTVGDGPYGPLQPDFDANGIKLPTGFSSRQIAVGQQQVSGTTYPWHGATDGQATFATLGTDDKPDGGWILVANSEVPAPGGGASAIEFSADGEIEDAYRILTGTTANCAGGPTPWGTWLSCEEYDQGLVWECDPSQLAPLVQPALGTFKHEAACVDDENGHVYLTEDQSDGCLYRFTPDIPADLSAGLLEVATVEGGAGEGTVTWVEVLDPAGALTPTRQQVAEAKRFQGGEGTWFDNGVVYFTTKRDNRVWAYHVGTSALEVLYDRVAAGADAPLSGVDNITVAPSGDIFVCEDGADLDICLITSGFEVSRFLKLDPEMHSGPPAPNPVAGNETVGVVFDPSGTRMYFGAQRSFGVADDENIPAGVVYEISGPFRLPPPDPGPDPEPEPEPDPDPQPDTQPQPNDPGDLAGGGATPEDGPASADGDSGSDAGTAANGGPVGGPDTDSNAALRLTAPSRRSIRRLLDAGLPITVELDELAGVKAGLRVATPNRHGRRRIATLARVRPNVALRGKVDLNLLADRRAERLLRGLRLLDAELEVTVSYADGEQTVLRRDVVLSRGPLERTP